MRGCVIDSWPLLAWLQMEQPAAGRTRALLDRAAAKQVRLWMCILNLGEVYHALAKTRGMSTARSARPRLAALPVEFVSVDDELVWAAADLKARHPISYADAFCASLARRKNVPVLTGDPDFRCLERSKVVKIRWVSRRP